MIEIQAWMTIWATYLNEDVHTEINEEEIYSKVDRIISNCKYNHIQLIERNGPKSIHISFYDNRKTVRSEELLDVFKNIAQTATGSYGILYYWDDEDPGISDDFQVLVARKGKCEWVKDLLLSPRGRMIFEEFE